MLRWLLLILLLCNALLFLWYAQRERVPPAEEEIGRGEVTRLRLLQELPPGGAAAAPPIECYQLGPFATAGEAEEAAQRLPPEANVTLRRPGAEAAIGYQLVIGIPAEAAARRELLDRLALAGWIPQTRRGHFLLGPFLGGHARREAELEQRALTEGLGIDSELQPILQPATGVLLEIELPAGAEIDHSSRQLLLRGWPGIKIEKKPCSGLARPQPDQ
ncbi:MAG: hypothetical protein SVU24_00355 [Pseudomonadota bacterium]|nr:hypothetical protein [Pseudomonadota bacterium]